MAAPGWEKFRSSSAQLLPISSLNVVRQLGRSLQLANIGSAASVHLQILF